MTHTDTYKTKLENMLAEITDELKTIGVHNPDVPEDWVTTTADMNIPEADPIDVADRTEEWDERRATLALLETQYNNIIRAQKKIAEGSFGVCEIGGEEIEGDRLQANPTARTCKEHMDEEHTLPNDVANN